MKTKWQYSLPVKFLALLLLTVFLCGTVAGFLGVYLCTDVGLYSENNASPVSTEQYVQTAAYRAVNREYRWNVNEIIEYFSDVRQTETINSREWLNQMRTRFAPENTNLRVVLENPSTGKTLFLSGLLGLQGDYLISDGFALAHSDCYYIDNVTGGQIGDFLDISDRSHPSFVESRDEYGNTVYYSFDTKTWLYPSGNTYFGSLDLGQPSVEEIEDHSATINVYYYLDTSLPLDDIFREDCYRYRMLQSCAFPLLALFVGSGLLALLTWVWLACAAGHRPNTEKEVITLRFIDRIPFDLFLCLWCGVFALVSAVLIEGVFPGFNDLTAMSANRVLLLGFVAVGYALLLSALTLSTAVRWKSRTLLRNTVIWRACAWLWGGLSGGAGKVAERLQSREKRELSPEEQAEKQKQRAETMDKVGKGAQKAAGALGGAAGSAWEWFAHQCGRVSGAFERLFETLPLVWKGIALLFFIGIINIFFLILVIDTYDGSLWAMALFAFDIMVLLLYMNTLKQMHWLHEGAKRIAAGDLEYRVPSEVMKWEFKTHAEALNAIRDGIDTAVEERVKAVEERIKSERMRTELLTNVSHDIKTPLTSIINYVGLLKKEPIEGEKAQEYLEVLDRQSVRLKKLLEDLLEASKASTGNITVNAAPTSVGELMRQVTGEYAEKLAAAGLEPIITLPAQDAMIFADGRLLWRVFDNLMANIVKYAMPQTRVYFDLRSDMRVTAVAVKNVSQERLNIAADELMERFVRGDQSRSTEGSGLGLSIAQSLTELMGGTFELVIDGDLFKVQISFPTLHGNPGASEAPLSEVVTAEPSPIVQPTYGAPAAEPLPTSPEPAQEPQPAAQTPETGEPEKTEIQAAANQTKSTAADGIQPAEAQAQPTVNDMQAEPETQPDTAFEVQSGGTTVQTAGPSPSNKTETVPETSREIK